MRNIIYRIISANIFLFFFGGIALAQSTAAPSQIGYLTTVGCPNGATVCFVQYGATIPVSGTFTPSGTQSVQGTGTAGTPAGGVLTVQGASGGTGLPTQSSPAVRTIIPLDISTVTTGGTAVVALNAGHRNAGGFLTNPKGATIDLCINEQGTASGTTSAGPTTCISPGQTYNLVPSAAAVSVISSDSSHPFSGEGVN